MTTLIIVMAFLALAHFVYEGIVAPSLRMHLRNKLFTLRDEVRTIKAQGVREQDERAFWYVHDGINNLLDRLPSLTLHARVNAAMAYRENDALQRVVQDRKQMLKDCGDQRIKAVFDKTTLVLEEVFAVNMGGWAFYVVPIAVFVATLGSFKRLVASLLLTPERDRERMLPQPA